MPNLDFYATREDFGTVLDFILNEARCAVFESYSVPGKGLREFRTSSSAIEAFDTSGLDRLGVMLHAPAMGGRFRIRRFDLSSGVFPNATWREQSEGWGLIQLELCGLRNGTLQNCHTNHNSEARARKWEAHYPELPPLAEWNFGEVARISSRINRHIRGLAVEKRRSRPILRGAQILAQQGVELR